MANTKRFVNLFADALCDDPVVAPMLCSRVESGGGRHVRAGVCPVADPAPCTRDNDQPLADAGGI